MRVVAAGKNMVCTGEANRQIYGARIEIHGVVKKLFQINAWRLRDVRSTIAERFVSAVQSFGKIWDRAAQMAQHPADIRKSLYDSAEDQPGGG